MLKKIFGNQIRRLHIIISFGIICWSAILAGLYFWAINAELSHHNKLIELKAAALGRQTQSLRRWVGGHGGVYVETGGDVAPLDSLSALTERDIQTESGRKITLLNSPSLLRRIVKEFEGSSSDRIRLIAYNPINPSGKPDPWEMSNLELLQKGQKEIREMVEKDGKMVFRLLYPIKLQPKCIKCHGDWKKTNRKVVGGLSVVVDKTPYDRSYGELVKKLSMGYLGLWFFGVIGLLLFDVSGAKLLKKIEYTSIHDKLTGLRNRGAIERRLHDELKLAERYNKPFSILLLDIDHFKQVNDQYGHHIGDETLRIVGNLLRQHIRETDISGRYGGEEFLILAPNTDLESSIILAQRILQGFHNSKVPLDDKTASISVTASIGISSLSEKVNSADELLKTADKALYKAKNQGRDCYRM